MKRSGPGVVRSTETRPPAVEETTDGATAPPETGLPPELRSFLEEPEAHTLLVRGPPGSGKTTLALTLLESLPGRRVLVTSRVPAELLARHHAWLRDRHSRVEVVESKVRSGDLRASARVASLWKAQGRAMPMETPASGLTPRDVEQLAWLPLELRELWLSLDPSTPATVAIDSWDALVDLYLSSGDARVEGTPSRAELERMLFDQVARSGARLVLVLEREEQSQLDYLSDGVVSTSVERSVERTERWLRLLKLRGVEIADDDYPFTLAGARFRCFSALPAHFRLDVAGAEAEPFPVPRHIWPGSQSFATLFGWFPWEQSTLIELDPTVSYEVARTLVAPVITHVLRIGGRALVASPPSRAYSDVVDLYRSGAPEELVRRNLRIMRMRDAPDPDDDIGRAVAMRFTDNPPPTAGDASETQGRVNGVHDQRFYRFRDVYRFLATANAPGVPNVSVGFVPTWQMLSAEIAGDSATPERYVWGIQRYLVGAPLHVIQIDRRDDATFDHLAKAAGTHLRVRERAGHIFVHGVRPWTPDHALLLRGAPSPDRAPYELVRIV